MTTTLLPPPVAPRKYTADDLLFWVETGFVSPHAKFELLDGEMIAVSPKGRHHEALRERLTDWLREPWSSGFGLMLEHTLRLDDATLLEPDFILYDRGVRIQDRPLVGADIKLLIEASDSSWDYDINDKAPKYAAFGVNEYWALHAVTRQARVHRGPSSGGWAEVRDLVAPARLVPLCAADASFAV